MQDAEAGAGPREVSVRALLVADRLDARRLERGATLTRHRMVGRVEVAEKPEALWAHPGLEPFYAHLEQELELPERSRRLRARR